MISYERARRLLLTWMRPRPATRVNLASSAGCVLARDIRARFDLPQFDKSAMDGCAVRYRDTRRAGTDSPVRLKLTGAVFAGDPARMRVEPGAAVKVMTGAAIPRGADAVVMKEFCGDDGEFVAVKQAVRRGENIRPRGREFKKGDVVLRSGTRITPPVIGLLAGCGHAAVVVHCRPRIALIVTGSELVPPGKPLRRRQIHDTNSSALAAALGEWGFMPVSVRGLNDEKPVLKRGLARAIKTSDVVITVGGVSMGDRDYVKQILEELGVQTIFDKVAVKPGKPTYFGVYHGSRPRTRSRPSVSPAREKFVFGLPGNPVSALVILHQLVKPALWRMIGLRDRPPLILPATLTKACRKKTDRTEWVRGSLKITAGGLAVTPTIGQESHMLGGLAQADCLIKFPAAQTALAKNTLVDIELLSWGE